VKNFIVAIDGPAGSGKSTTARIVAEQLGFLYIDTGAMYRAAALWMLRRGVDVRDANAVEAAVADCTLKFEKRGGEQSILLNGENVTREIRGHEVTRAVSLVSSYAAVREKMVALQRGYAETGAIVMDGRDIGTVVFPSADVKVFLSASLSARALRRRRESADDASDAPTVDELAKELAERDERDSSRALSPLRKADDAIEIDTTNLTIREQVQAVVGAVKNKMAEIQRANR